MNRYPSNAFATVHPHFTQRTEQPFDLASWGIEDVAYVKPVFLEGEDAYGIFAADGTELAQVENRDEAIITIRQNDLEAMSVH